MARALITWFGWVIDGLLRWRWALGVFAFALLVLLRAHGFSLGIWNTITSDYAADYRHPSIGKHRAIRSDEYMVSTPTVLGQCAHPDFFPRINERFGGGGMNMFLTTPSSPVWDWTAVGQAHNWGYFLFGAERGLAWNWWIRTLGLFLFAFEFFLLWLRRDRGLALTASLAVCWGAPTQWWDTTVPYLLLYFFASLVFLNRLFACRRATAQWAAGAGLLVALASFGFSFYPLFQLLLAYAWVPLAFAMVRAAGATRSTAGRAWIILGLVVALWAAEWAYFGHVHGATIETIRNSAYPGARRFAGGSFGEFFPFFHYWLVCLFTPFREIRFRNACEVSMFAVPMLALVASFLRVWRVGRRPSPSVLCLAVLGGMLATWILLPWPAALAGATGLRIVTPNRAAVVMGFVFLLLTFRVFHDCAAGGVRFSRAQAAALTGISVLSLAVVCRTNPEILDFFVGTRPFRGIPMLLTAAALLSALSIGLLRANRSLFIGGYVVGALLTGLYVHPLSVGASPILDKQLAEKAREVELRHGPGRWLTNDSRFAQYLLANGMDVLNGIHHTPNVALWRTVDPEERYAFAWNRYANISANIATNDWSSIELLRGNSTVMCTLTRADLARLKVRYVLWSGSKLRYPWTEYQDRVRLNFIYRLIPGDAVETSTEHATPSPTGADDDA